jgi:class 3 adenylate cyclase
MLGERIEHPERTEEIDEKIRRRFEKVRSIFVLDMSGFSRTVQRHGLIHYLAMIHRMQRVVTPIIQKTGGYIVKFEADNCFAVFPSSAEALEAAVQIKHDLNVMNLVTEDTSDVHISVGIGYGPILLFCDDMYGNEMNLASKLGEDLAERDEILLTEAAHEALKNASHTFETLPFTISGVDMQSHKLKED